MRLWSLHPRLLDARGIVALWREGLLARAVLSGKTRGYLHHPQLRRFFAHRDPLAALDCYLSRVLDEALLRGYRFDGTKINYRKCTRSRTPVATDQLDYEWKHLLKKIAVRDPDRGRGFHSFHPEPHPCFRVVPGPTAEWENTQDRS
jgi:hypothetical protein